MSKEKYTLEDQIRELIFDDNKNSAHFEYYQHKDGGNPYVKASVITLNKKTNASFLLTEAKADSAEHALQQILNYLINNSSGYHTYTIKWYEKGVPADRPYKSKFRAKDMVSAIEKFYYGKNTDSLVIYSISDDDINSKDYEG